MASTAREDTPGRSTQDWEAARATTQPETHCTKYSRPQACLAPPAPNKKTKAARDANTHALPSLVPHTTTKRRTKARCAELPLPGHDALDGAGKRTLFSGAASSKGYKTAQRRAKVFVYSESSRLHLS